MKRILLISSALVAVLLLSSCSFHDIESNKSIITTTTVDSNSTGFVPEGTTTPSSTNTPTTDSTENPDSKDGYPVKMKTTANVNARAGASTVDEIFFA